MRNNLIQSTAIPLSLTKRHLLLQLGSLFDCRFACLKVQPVINLPSILEKDFALVSTALEMSSLIEAAPQSEFDSASLNLLDDTIARATNALLAKQYAGGWWVGELQGDSILESEFILLKWILGQESDPDLVKIANYLRRLQNPDGGWGLYPGGPPDLSGTVKAYFALKLCGDAPDSPHLCKARELIHSMGGAEKTNTFSRFYFACLGQISFDSCPSIPPEIVFIPQWFYFNLYNVSAWTRTMILPLGIVTTLKPVRKLPDSLGMRELYLNYEAGNRLGIPSRVSPERGRIFFFGWIG